MSYNDIPDTFLDNETIYHYTKLSTALEDVLYKNVYHPTQRTLRLSPRGNSTDPFEKFDDYFPMEVNYEGSQRSVNDEEIKAIYEYLKNRFNKVKEICFCMNNNSEPEPKDCRDKKMNTYGFLKPRMWDRYADGFSGVCLAFSKNKLEENNPNFDSDRIDYKHLNKLPGKKIAFNAEDLDKMGFEETKKKYQSKIDKVFFSKHQDYSGENEFRFCSYSEYKEDYLDISNSLKGIFFIENRISEFGKESLQTYAKKYEVGLFGLRWTNFGVGFNICKS